MADQTIAPRRPLDQRELLPRLVVGHHDPAERRVDPGFRGVGAVGDHPLGAAELYLELGDEGQGQGQGGEQQHHQDHQQQCTSPLPDAKHTGSQHTEPEIW